MLLEEATARLRAQNNRLSTNPFQREGRYVGPALASTCPMIARLDAWCKARPVPVRERGHYWTRCCGEYEWWANYWTGDQWFDGQFWDDDHFTAINERRILPPQ